MSPDFCLSLTYFRTADYPPSLYNLSVSHPCAHMYGLPHTSGQSFFAIFPSCWESLAHTGFQSHTCRQTEITSHEQTHTITSGSCSGQILYCQSSASEPIFAEGLPDITKLHLTYRDLIPVVFTKHSQRVCLSKVIFSFLCISQFIKKRRGAVGLPASVW